MSVKAQARRPGVLQVFLAVILWAVALLMIAIAAVMFVKRGLPMVLPASAAQAVEPAAAPTATPTQAAKINLPAFSPPAEMEAVVRHSSLHTIIPSRPRTEVIKYSVQKGDSVFSIANKFNLKPETILWANYDQLNDNPDMLKPNLSLNIPAIDGVYYKWQQGDSIEMVAATFKAKTQDILNWLGNHMDLTHPAVAAGQYIMVPGGKREFRQWVVPVIPRGNAGVVRSVLGAGSCDTGLGGANGSGSFIWPAAAHTLSGNDYWSGHLGIDIAAGEGAGIAAADAGVVVYSGWSDWGYGYMIMIDHGNGYQTLYAHLSQLNVRCGASVGKGAKIGEAGNTGNSFGSHLHFEVRYLGGFVSPWSVLP